MDRTKSASLARGLTVLATDLLKKEGRKESIYILSSHTGLMKMTKQAIIQPSMQTTEMSMTSECLKHSNVN